MTKIGGAYYEDFRSDSYIFQHTGMHVHSHKDNNACHYVASTIYTLISRNNSFTASIDTCDIIIKETRCHGSGNDATEAVMMSTTIKTSY